MLSTVYVSRSSFSFTEADLATLLMNSRATNGRLGITGMLLHSEGRFIQALEGPEAAVRDRLAVIAADPRHTAVRTLVEEDVTERQFPAWTMGYPVATDDFASSIPGYDDFFGDDTDAGTAATKARTLLTWFRDQPALVTDAVFSNRAS